MATGWTWEYVWENMTLQRLEVMGRLWKKAPPEHVSAARIYALFAAWLGVKEESNVPAAPAQLPGFLTLPDIEE